jgi:hypothetical protein
MQNKDRYIVEHELIIPVDKTNAGNDIKVDLGTIEISADGTMSTVKIDGKPASHVLGGPVSRINIELLPNEPPKLNMTVSPMDMSSEISEYSLTYGEKRLESTNEFDDDFEPGVGDNCVFPFSD